MGTERIGIVGMGYVGTALADRLRFAGFEVMGFDIEERPNATSDMSKLEQCSVAIICVPTPLRSDGKPDLSCVLDAACDVRCFLPEGSLVVLESTTYPGTTRDLFGADPFLVAYSPEREDPGRTTQTWAHKIVGGLSDESAQAAKAIYERIFDEVTIVSSPEVAEAAKAFENTYRLVNIALVNELKMGLTEMGIDVWEVLDAAETKPFGFQRFNPSAGAGGHCIPVDPIFLYSKTNMPLIALAASSNSHAWTHVYNMLMREIDVEDKIILLLGIAYKKNVSDTRNSPAFELGRYMEDRGAEVHCHDTHVRTDEFPQIETLDLISGYDAVILLTDHDDFDYDKIRQADLIVDTTNRIHDAYGKIVRA